MKKMVTVILAMLLCAIILVPTFTYASQDINTDDYKEIYTSKDNDELIKAGGSVVAIVQVIGVSCGIILLIILAIKYFFMAPYAGEKATIREKLIPYVIGAVILFGGTGILSIVAHFAQNMDAPSTNVNTQPVTSFVTCPNCGAYVPNVTVCQQCHQRLKN